PGDARARSRSRLLYRRQSRESLPGVRHSWLQLCVRVLPELDEGAIMLNGLLSIPHRLVQLSETFVDRRQSHRVHVGIDFRPVRRGQIPLEHHGGGIRYARGVIRAREVEWKTRRTLVRRQSVVADVSSAKLLQRVHRLAIGKRDLAERRMQLRLLR